MELRELAERIVFGTTLDEKLQRADTITDDQPGQPVKTPLIPGRPAELQFKAQVSGKGEFPGAHRLGDERERGRLLHFFANHELLATELMALVLLRFPEAPAAFRRGVLQTLKDEQEHTRLYIQRMRECGIGFGELPVSGYFWRSVSGMEHPIDYVAGLSLTFEQANLDFCREFAQGFSAAGDADTARLLEGIYKDEIAHVAYGLKWFRRWKNPNESDWRAFCRQLKYPLSPNRAKGDVLNVEGRRAAGFDAEFVDELKVYSQSKGRTPNVFLFNPFEEARLAQGNRFTPVKPQVALATDLSNLPQFLCRRDDVVVVERRPSAAFLSGIKEAGFTLPEFVELKEGRLDPQCGLIGRKIAGLRPWAWGPGAREIFEPLFADSLDSSRCETYRQTLASTEKLYSKAWSATFLRRRLEAVNQESWLCTGDEVGVSASSLEEVLSAVEGIRRRGHHRVVMKEALGLAGHNAIRLWEPEIQEAQRRWIENSTRDGGTVVVEPWLEREMDFSIQLEMEADGIKVCGYTGLVNDTKGQFRANWALSHYRQRIPPQAAELLRGPNDIADRLQRFYDGLILALGDELKTVGFRGPLGIDVFVYRTAEGRCRLKPVVEINPRYTMGRLTVELMKQAAPGSSGEFRLVNRAMLKAEGLADFREYARRLAEQAPLQLEGAPSPKIREGAICLNDPEAAKNWLAVFQVENKHKGTEARRGKSG